MSKAWGPNGSESGDPVTVYRTKGGALTAEGKRARASYAARLEAWKLAHGGQEWPPLLPSKLGGAGNG